MNDEARPDISQHGLVLMTHSVLDAIKEQVPADKRPLVDQQSAHVDAVLRGNKMTTMKSRDGEVHQFMPPFNCDVVEWQFDNWTPRSGDVTVASYPKTGTTWLREVTRQIVNHGNEKALAASKLCETPFLGYLEGGTSGKFEVIDELPIDKRVWATHLQPEVLNMDKYIKQGMKFVYVMRNPKDMTVSLRKFLDNLPWITGTAGIREYYPEDMNGFVKSLVAGKMPMQMKAGEWYPHHIRSWMKYRNHHNFHFVFFEEMKRDPKKETARLAKFLGATLTDEQLDEIISVTSFDSMKKSGSYSKMKFFRKGGVGNWKEHFTDEQSELVDEMMKKDLGDLDIQFTYEL